MGGGTMFPAIMTSPVLTGRLCRFPERVCPDCKERPYEFISSPASPWRDAMLTAMGDAGAMFCEQTDAHAPLVALAGMRGVLAIITGTYGPSYRPLGAMMAVIPGGRRVGMLSSGCIDGDVELHAMQALEDGCPRSLRYGEGSPFVDIRLPCGGGLDVLILPNPDPNRIAQALADLATRRVGGFSADPTTGAMDDTDRPTGMWDGRFHLRLMPEIRLLAFGKGPEVVTLAAMAQAARFPLHLLSHDEETLDLAQAAGCPLRHITEATIPQDLRPDPHTAIALLFHDHEWEPPILRDALASHAFYVGALGSRGANAMRLMALRDLGVSEGAISRLRAPIGLIPSTRDPRTLAVSILAEILAIGQERGN